MSPNEITFNSLLSAGGSRPALWYDVLELLRRMPKMQQRPDEISSSGVMTQWFAQLAKLFTETHGLLKRAAPNHSDNTQECVVKTIQIKPHGMLFKFWGAIRGEETILLCIIVSKFVDRLVSRISLAMVGETAHEIKSHGKEWLMHFQQDV